MFVLGIISFFARTADELDVLNRAEMMRLLFWPDMRWRDGESMTQLWFRSCSARMLFQGLGSLAMWRQGAIAQ